MKHSLFIFLLIITTNALAQSKLEELNLKPIVIESKNQKVPLNSRCYTEGQNNDIDTALDEGVKALFTLRQCREWRDKYRLKVESLEENPLITYKYVTKEGFVSKQKLYVGIGASIILGVLMGMSI